MRPLPEICAYCNSHTTLNKDRMCHFCRVKYKGVKPLKVKSYCKNDKEKVRKNE